MKFLLFPPPNKLPYYVYAMLAYDDGESMYVKFGVAFRIWERLSQIKVGCPLPIQYIGILDVSIKQRALEVEKALHKHFVERNSQGEWFKFSTSSELDKQSFRDGCKTVFLMELGKDFWWTNISVKALEKYEIQRRAGLFASGHLPNINRTRAEKKRIKEAYKELSS